MTSEKFLRDVFGPVSQQSYPQKIFLLREIDGVVEKLCAVAVALVLPMHHEVLEEHNETAFGRTNRKQQIDHAHDRAVATQHENAPATGLFENEPQPTELFVLVGSEVAFLSKQFAQQLRQFVQIGFGCRFDYDVFAHPFGCLSQKIGVLAIGRSSAGARHAIDNALLTPTVTALKSRRDLFRFYETHLSAVQANAEASARLSRPHANQGRARHPRTAPTAGPQTPASERRREALRSAHASLIFEIRKFESGNCFGFRYSDFGFNSAPLAQLAEQLTLNYACYEVISPPLPK